MRDQFVRRVTAVAQALDDRLPTHLSRLLRRVGDSELLRSASSLAFYGLVSAFPLLLLAFAAVGAVAGEETLEAFADQVADGGPDGTSELVDQLVDSGGSLTLATLVLTIWPATAYGGGLRTALGRHTERSEPAPGLRGRLLGLSLVLALPAFVMAGVPLVFLLTTLSGDGALATTIGWGIAIVAAVALGTAFTTLLYRAFAPGSLALGETASGAVLTAVVTGTFSLAFAAYLQVGEIEERFGGGTIGIVVLLGVWLFAANIVLLGGFETVLELADENDDPTGRSGEGREPT